MIRLALADRLKRYREKAGMTIYDVGEKIGKSGKTVSAWECGRGQPDADMLLTLCKLYGIDSISELYGESSARSNLLPDEVALIRDYRDASAEIREEAAGMLARSAERNRKDGKMNTSAGA